MTGGLKSNSASFPVSPPSIFLIATRNQHKVAELRTILGPGFALLTLADFPDVPSVVEDAQSFAGNATKKAVTLAEWLSLLPVDAAQLKPTHVLADDSGLEVDALEGAPGVHSARFAALDAESAPSGNSPDAANNDKLLRLLKDVPASKRAARFRCVLALTPVIRPVHLSTSPVCYADESEFQTQLFEGICPGHIGFGPKGQGGFGYDPLFIPDGQSLSFAELGETVKNALSHRAQAVARLKAALEHGASG